MRVRTRLTVALPALAAFCAFTGAPATSCAQTPANDAPLSLSVAPAFHVSAGLAHVGWSAAGLSGATGLSLTASRHITGPVQVTFDFATASGNTVSGSGAEAARDYLVDAALEVAPELSAAGRPVQPEVGLGIGTLVSDPAADSSSTRSQNDWDLRLGVVVGVGGPFTVGVRYRRMSVSLQDVAASGATVPSTPMTANVVEVRLGVRF
jgi:Outer membrane protein beta-barrel domain